MGNSSSSSHGCHGHSHSYSGGPQQGGGVPNTGMSYGQASAGGQRPLNHSTTTRFRAIADNFRTVDQVQDALRRNGLESSQLIIGFDFTKSNEWTGKHSFGNRSLHDIRGSPNPYETAASIIGRTLAPFDDDNMIPCFGFGDMTTHDTGVFSFFPNEAPAQGLQQVVWRYRQIVPHVSLSGPTSFAPLIHQAMRTVIASGMQYHICIIIADGQVTRSVDMEPGQLGPQEMATVNAIVAASNLPLSIIMVGVGDGPFDLMQEFDDALPARKFDNFQFVNFTQVMAETAHAQPAQREALFALRALMEIPEQYKEIVRAGMLGAPTPHVLSANFCDPPLGPPAAVLEADSRLSNQGGAQQANAPQNTASVPQMTNPAGQDVPDQMFICPITQDVMTTPMMAADGYNYEQSAIREWLSAHSTSPISNETLAHKNLIPNHQLRSAIQDWQEKQQRQQPSQQQSQSQYPSVR